VFARAQKVLKQRTTVNEKKQQITCSTKGQVMLSGLVFCGHCGGRLTPERYQDRYIRRDGTEYVADEMKYCCYHNRRKLCECDGQVTYKAERIDEAVSEIVRSIFGRTHCAPDRQSVEREYKAQILSRSAAQKKRWQEIEKLRNRLEKLQAEVANSLTGDSVFSPAQLSQAINSEQKKLDAAEAEYGDVQQSIENQRQSINAIIPLYQTFLGWAREFDGAALERRKMIISQLVSSVTVSRDYKIDIDFNLDYRQYCEGWRDTATMAKAAS
jgi:hypothetical protein